MLGRNRSTKRVGRGADSTSVNFGSDTASIASEIEAWEHIERPNLSAVLIAQGVVTPEEMASAEADSLASGVSLSDVLTNQGIVDDNQLAAALAVQFQIPRADLRNERPEPEAIDRVGEELARRFGVMPLFIDENDRIFLATAEPLDTAAIEELTLHCQRIGLMIGARSDIERLIDQSYTVLRSAAEHIKAFELVDAEEEAYEESESLVVDENAPIVQVVNRLLMQGVRARASDIHIEPEENYIRVRYRIDGALSEAIRLPRRMGAPIASRIKVMAELNIVERRRPQDGQFSIAIDKRPVDIRTSVVGTVHGEKIVLRLLDKTRSLIGLDQLGMPPQVVAPYLEIVKSPLGMLLCTGPTGSGKTTTLYATLSEVNDVSRNVVTIEDPVEYQFAGVNQMPISEAAGITFADGLRGILRQDPDTILVGEIRDIETARIATQAALTGHFVLSSLHAVDAVSAVHRFTDMGIEPFLVASAISGVVGQRLLRRVCEDCREEYEPTPDHIRLVAAGHGSVPDVWTRGVGCNVCNGTGYNGRVGVYELLKVTDEIRDEIVNKSTAREIRNTAMSQGMRTMQQEAFRLVTEGITTVDDVLRSVYAPGMDDVDEDTPRLGGRSTSADHTDPIADSISDPLPVAAEAEPTASTSSSPKSPSNGSAGSAAKSKVDAPSSDAPTPASSTGSDATVEVTA